MKFGTFFLAMFLATGTAHADDQGLVLVAAGSLKTALGEVAENYAATYGTAVATRFGPSGLIRKSIEDGEPAHVFASANMAHPRTLEDAGLGSPVALFARNKLCAIARPGVGVSTSTLIDVIRDAGTRLGTSTPKADPSGDYAWAFFEKTGHGDELKAKALQLTGGPDSKPAPEGRNTYGWVLDSDQADVFVTYCTNAVLARSDVPDLQIVALPNDLSVGADYGLIVLRDAPPAAWHLAMYILSPEGQAVLAKYGFDAAARPAGD